MKWVNEVSECSNFFSAVFDWCKKPKRERKGMANVNSELKVAWICCFDVALLVSVLASELGDEHESANRRLVGVNRYKKIVIPHKNIEAPTILNKAQKKGL